MCRAPRGSLHRTYAHAGAHAFRAWLPDAAAHRGQRIVIEKVLGREHRATASTPTKKRGPLHAGPVKARAIADKLE
jgi:hypothetical protein